MTKILLLSDIHGHDDMAAAAIARHPDVEHILIAGDLTNFGDAGSARSVIEALCSGNSRNPGSFGILGRTSPRIRAVAGNCDPVSVRNYMSAAGFNVEGMLIELPYGTLVGAGGGLRRAGLTSFERTEAQLDEALSTQLSSAAEKGRKKPVIVLTHTPPYGTNADLLGGKHVGSKEFARMMIERVPDVWICGHIHESRSISTEDGTLVVNPGPCGNGYHAILEVNVGPDGKTSVRAELFR